MSLRTTLIDHEQKSQTTLQNACDQTRELLKENDATMMMFIKLFEQVQKRIVSIEEKLDLYHQQIAQATKMVEDNLKYLRSSQHTPSNPSSILP